MKKLLCLLFLTISTSVFAEPINLPNLGKNVTGTSLGGGHYGVDIAGTVSTTNSANGAPGSAIPSEATLVGGTNSGTLRAISVDSTGHINVKSDAVGFTVIHSVRNDYTSVSVDTSNWVQLIASTSAVTNGLYFFDSSGQTMEIGIGGAGSEVHLLYISPGGNGYLPIRIASGSRVAIRAVSSTASVGSFLGEFMQ